MGRKLDYVGVSAFGIKIGVVVPGSDVPSLVLEALHKCKQDELLDNGDTVCITESIVARAQQNFVTVADIATDLTNKLNLQPNSRIGVMFPILSRNRFALILKGLAMAVPKGKIVLQLSYPADEVGNQLIPYDFLETWNLGYNDVVKKEQLEGKSFRHPITDIDYIALYEEAIQNTGAEVETILSNNLLALQDYDLDGTVICNIHERHRISRKLNAAGMKAITLQDLCNDSKQLAWSEWGLLGSNLSSGDRLKLAPQHANEVAAEVQKRVKETLDCDIEVIIYGDGAYKDPSTGIYELADPQPAFGMTAGLDGKYREGLKYKYLVDQMVEAGVEINQIEKELALKKQANYAKDSIEMEGTTPRKAEDLIASLSDLISGSADAATPIVLVKNFLK